MTKHFIPLLDFSTIELSRLIDRAEAFYLLTLKQEFNSLNGLKIAICGNVMHSRVAKTFLFTGQLFGFSISLSDPPEFLPKVKNAGSRDYGIRCGHVTCYAEKESSGFKYES